ncbi:MAG: hypothetical protein LBE27_05230 [Deltaproteobacteria bacterium]|nr:hypothetical protein [Deltaproteobacteria bacterium]
MSKEGFLLAFDFFKKARPGNTGVSEIWAHIGGTFDADKQSLPHYWQKIKASTISSSLSCFFPGLGIGVCSN